MQSVSSRIWTRVAVSNSYDDNDYTTGKIVLFQAIQFTISIKFSSIWAIDRTLSGTSTPNQKVPGSGVNEGVVYIPQISSITETFPSDCQVFSIISRTLDGGGLTPLQKSSWCILQPQPTGQYTELNVKVVLFQTIQFSISTQIKNQNSSISSYSV